MSLTASKPRLRSEPLPLADRRLLILGAGSQASLCINSARQTGDFDVVGLVDVYDTPTLWGTRIDGVEILGNLDAVAKAGEFDELEFVVSIGELVRRQELVAHVNQLGGKFATVIHPHACVAPSAVIGAGCLINAGVVIEPHARIGNYVTIRAGSVISHDVVLEDYASISPGVTLAGRSKVGQGGTIYTGATVTPNVTIGANCIVGAGAVVLNDVASGTTVFGVPACASKRNA